MLTHIRRSTLLLTTLTAAMVASTLLQAAPAEVRGTWLTTTGPDHIRSGFNTESVTGDLRSIGLNTVYVESWKNGYTNFPSPTLATLTGGPDRSTFLGSNRDLMQETLINAHRNQMNVSAWFEYGFAAQFVGSGGTPSNPLATHMRNQGWLLQDQTGQFANGSNGFAWMNPAVPEVRQFLIDITLEAVERYDLDGIQFDDRLAWPREFGWDPTTAGLYHADTGNLLPLNVNDTAFSNWRQQQVSEFAAELSAAVRSARPDLQLSVSPSIAGFSEPNFNADWTTWVDDDLFDEFVPQVYRSSIGSFNSTIDSQVAPFEPNDLDELIVGIRINGSGAATPAADVLQMINRTRQEGAAGHSLWYSSGVRDLYDDELESFYDVAGEGHADNPNFPTDHRPAPLVASSVGANDWNVNVTEAGRYRVIGRQGGIWKELTVAALDAGTHQLAAANVTQLELLVDRRSSTVLLGDFGDDGNIAGNDFLKWQTAKSLVNPESSLGDANLDGLVDSLDLERWQLNYGWSSSPLAQQTFLVPEPGSIGLFVLGFLAASIRSRSGNLGRGLR
ncbi:MAG: family 10 glycosylhydrolase [Lacipirellulaceae bacterium]